MSSAALAITNAVQFSVCSEVLRVLGLAGAGPSGAFGFVCVRGLDVKPFLGVCGLTPDLPEMGVGGYCSGERAQLQLQRQRLQWAHSSPCALLRWRRGPDGSTGRGMPGARADGDEPDVLVPSGRRYRSEWNSRWGKAAEGRQPLPLP